MKNLIFRLQLLHLLTGVVLGDDIDATGTIQGKLQDTETKSPLVGANVLIVNTKLGAVTDLEGNFVIPNVPVGSYTLRCSNIGYETLMITDVIVKSQRLTFVNDQSNNLVLRGGNPVENTFFIDNKIQRRFL